MGILLSVICCFSLTAFTICSLCLIFVSLIKMYLGLFHLGYVLLGLSGFLGLGWLFPSYFRRVFSHYLLKYFLMPFLFSYSSGTSIIRMLWHLTLPQSFLKLSSFFKFLFSFLLRLYPLFYLPPPLSFLLPLILYY